MTPPVSTSTKKAELEEAGIPWPVCECHGEPKRWRARSGKKGGYFSCPVPLREYQRRTRAERLKARLCVHCGGELETQTMCSPCLDRHREASWRHDQTPKRQVKKRAINAARHQRRRASEGFRPTGVGLAAFAAWTGKAGDTDG